MICCVSLHSILKEGGGDVLQMIARYPPLLAMDTVQKLPRLAKMFRVLMDSAEAAADVINRQPELLNRHISSAVAKRLDLLMKLMRFDQTKTLKACVLLLLLNHHILTVCICVCMFLR
jgi:hypothetical protein